MVLFDAPASPAEMTTRACYSHTSPRGGTRYIAVTRIAPYDEAFAAVGSACITEMTGCRAFGGNDPAFKRGYPVELPARFF